MKRNRLIALALCAVFVTAAQAQSNRKVSWTTQNDDFSMTVRMDGDIEFARDYRSVTSMSRDAYIRIRQERGPRDLRLDVERDGSSIAYDFRRNGDRVAFADARQEIGDLIQQVVRETGVDAERRVKMLLAEGGPDLVLDEVYFIESNGASARYLGLLLEHGDLHKGHLMRVAEAAKEEVHSSGTRARLMIQAVEFYVGDQDLEEAWVEVVESIPSSGDRSRTLLAGLDSEMNPSTVFDAVRTIPSSGDKSRVLLKVLESPELTSSDIGHVLSVVNTVPSSGDKTRVLVKVAPRIGDDGKLWDAYFAATREVPSSGDRMRVLLSMIDNADLSRATWLALIKTAESIPSSGDKTRVLLKASAHVEGEDMEAAYLSAAETISSSGDRARVLTALLRNSG